MSNPSTGEGRRPGPAGVGCRPSPAQTAGGDAGAGQTTIPAQTAGDWARSLI